MLYGKGNLSTLKASLTKFGSTFNGPDFFRNDYTTILQGDFQSKKTWYPIRLPIPILPLVKPRYQLAAVP